ncbi:MAG: hypothetical protein ABMB14_02870 [Myxococcota bacterium]
MAAEFVIGQPCEVKRALGGGDVDAGTLELSRLLKVREIARALEAQAAEHGVDPGTLVAHHRRRVVGGESSTVEVTQPELVADAAQLDPLASHCVGCPMNVFDSVFGCYTALQYPIGRVVEQHLLDRLQPADEAGGFLLLSAIRDLGYTGAPIAQLRGHLFEADVAPTRALDPGLDPGFDPGDAEGTTVSADSLWHAWLAMGPQLAPGHLMMLLVWLGALRLDGEVPRDGASLAALAGLADPDQRLARTTIDLGPPAGPELGPIKALLFAAYAAWIGDLPLSVDA